MLKVCQFDEHSVTTCKFIKFMKIHLKDGNLSNKLNQFDYIWSSHQFHNSDLLCFALISYFLTFPGGGGWVAGWVVVAP